MTEELPSIRDAITDLAAARGISELDALRWVAGAAESAAIAARREGELKPHRIAHDIVENEVLVETFEAGHRDNTREPKDGKPGLRKVVERRNQRDECPDCGRWLVAAADVDLPHGITHLLVCPRVHGFKIAGADLSDHDIVACGLGA